MQGLIEGIKNYNYFYSADNSNTYGLNYKCMTDFKFTTKENDLSYGYYSKTRA